MKVKLFIVLNIVLVILLFLYSFTQVDLGLTLTRASFWQQLQQAFQYIGYFNRPLSTFLYIILLIFLFVFYSIFLYLVRHKKITDKQVWFVVGFVGFISLFAYNAFSYDLFNYVFDAKIVTFYNQNPYEKMATDYPQDPMLGFMHWTHRTFPYGPTWLLVTVPLSFIGFQFFLPTLILFKMLMAGCYIGTIFCIGKILEKTNTTNKLYGMVFFGLNPLVIIESLVSAHNDIVMVFLAVGSLYFLLERKYIRSVLLLILSIGIKYSTFFLLPIYSYISYRQHRNKAIQWERVFLAMTILMIIPVIMATFRTNFQPWYLLNIIPFATLVSKKYYIIIPTIGISVGALLQYVPFLYTGNWDPPIPFILTAVMVVSGILSLLACVIYRVILVKQPKHVTI